MVEPQRGRLKLLQVPSWVRYLDKDLLCLISYKMLSTTYKISKIRLIYSSLFEVWVNLAFSYMCYRHPLHDFTASLMLTILLKM